MAYNLRKINVVDLRPSIGVGVKLPFSAATAFTSVYSTKEQTKFNLINFLLTDKGERPFNPTFGVGLRSKLFEQISQVSLDEIETSIKSQVENNFPNVLIRDLSVLGDPDNNSIKINFSYVLTNSKETDTVILEIQNA
jgi:phage baseplate assembly protein W